MKVRYNGSTTHFGNCSGLASTLEVGKVYEVIDIKVHSWYTELTLKGVAGTFNSAWFDDIEKPILFAIGDFPGFPVVGQRLSNFQVWRENQWIKIIRSSTIKSVEFLSKTTFKVETENTIYIVQTINS